MIKRRFVATLLLAVPLSFPVLAYAADGGAKTNDDDPSINALGTGVNQILKVLQVHPDSASDSCINALKEMHAAQDQLSKEEGHENNQDVEVARDVTASSMEDVTTICGTDARTLCRESAGQNPALAAACHALPHEDD
ncbi:hypothetical protein Gbth_025_032 [Gluconobacter thailandicus F149-1 = NBRC 100600]|uniref:Secreted protein n=1 Tax=Gluconobacter thailandicus NBRC 3257 TaxID=1381097 RepID=A0ABQ0IUW4_GLUTH|nr:hypothetical protein [Gluconobacter thailandicus]KXV52174.1 hypothetical protein AD946_14680 [Gluconobacter thailandicus]GAC86436.1 hypothetical protein NBRC3255_0097 [Gluconobacter thailandicus NBRC 3255]GAD25997.1 hypothetical protein NBRC3257_0996 [Gluconobacter thailandicus NBRC 3257]GAN93567.1 hypothetical protein Gbth_025_032 [Gluconobacter thailandicus F149-1 = NBRC 100600]GBR60025.1 hypothetical protein AA100600_1653 [Gluconobacter thailandicus F149-1 = NBRC 100600]